MSFRGVTAHGCPSGPLQFDRLGSSPWPPQLPAEEKARHSEESAAADDEESLLSPTTQQERFLTSFGMTPNR